jgi:hypothetical protein
VLLHANFESFVIEGERDLFDRKRENEIRQAFEQLNFFEKHVPYAQAIEGLFDTAFKTPIVFMFYNLGKDYYSKFAKVTIFVLLVLLPGLICFLSLLLGKMLDWIDPIPEMVPATMTAKQLEEQERQKKLQAEYQR